MSLNWEHLESEALKATRRVSSDRCFLGRFLDSLDSKAQGFVDVALSNTNIGHSALHQALAERGFRGSREVLTRHRKSKCICYKDTT